MMNILIVSNNDACRSRMAMEILTSFGRGMKVFTAGVLPGNGIPDTVFSVMEQNGYHLSHFVGKRKKAGKILIMW